MEVLRKYGVATTILFPLVDRGTIDFESTPVTFVAADTQISKNEGTFANTGSTPVHEGKGIYSLALTATEMQAARISIACIDAATKAWEDQAIIIATYGHASAQHAFDLDLAEQTVALSAQGKLDVNAEADTALTDYDAATGAEIAAVQTDTDNIQARLPAALVGGRMDSDIGAKTGNVALSAQEKLDVNAEADTALTDYDAVIPADLNDPTAAAIADQVWDEARSGHVAAGSFGQASQAAIVRNGTAQAGAASTITLDSGASATDDIFNDTLVVIVSGTGVGQTRLITDYVGSTKVATISPAWQTNPDATSVFVVLAAGEITGASAPSAATIADAVWDELSAGHTGAGKAGEQQWTDIDAILADTNELQTDDVPTKIAALNDPTVGAIADQVWEEAQADHVAAGSFGVLATEIASILADTGTDGVVISAATAQSIADEILKRDIDNVEVAAAKHSLCVAILKSVSKVADDAGTLKVYLTDGTTLKLSQAVATDVANDPIDSLTVGV